MTIEDCRYIGWRLAGLYELLHPHFNEHGELKEDAWEVVKEIIGERTLWDIATTIFQQEVKQSGRTPEELTRFLQECPTVAHLYNIHLDIHPVTTAYGIIYASRFFHRVEGEIQKTLRKGHFKKMSREEEEQLHRRGMESPWFFSKETCIIKIHNYFHKRHPYYNSFFSDMYLNQLMPVVTMEKMHEVFAYNQ
jgi:hypothetical protein